jgi:hypothetical protein
MESEIQDGILLEYRDVQPVDAITNVAARVVDAVDALPV